MAKKNRLHSRHHLQPRIKPIWLVLLVALALVIWGTYSFVYQRGVREAKQAIEQQSFAINQTNKNSLDLRLAAKASYDASSLQVIEELPARNGVRSQVLKFYVEGLEQYALLTMPTSQPPADGYPVILLLHGYVKPSAYQTKTAYVGDMEHWSRQGYAVIKPDLRGNGKSKGLAEGAYYSMAYNTDVMTLLTAIQDTPSLRANKIAVWGHSMGGYIGLRAAVLSPQISHVVILAGAVGTAQQMFTSYTAPSDRLNPIAREFRFEALRINKDPVENPDFWYHASPYSRLANTTARFQIHVGLMDEVVPPAFSASLRDAFKKANVSHEYYTYPKGKHGLIAERKEINTRMAAFLGQ